MKTCLRFTEAGTEYDETGAITKMGTILDISFVGDDHDTELRDEEYHVTGTVTSITQVEKK